MDALNFTWFVDQTLFPFDVAMGRFGPVEEKTYHIGMRILAGLTALALFPITLAALAIRWWRGEEADLAMQEVQEKVVEVPPVEKALNPREQVRAELERIQSLDVKLGEPVNGSWRAYGARHGETNQTFTDYTQTISAEKLATDHRLYIQRLGTFSEQDLKIIAIACDFMKVMVGIPVQQLDGTMTMEELKTSYLEWIEQDYQNKLKQVGGSEDDREFYQLLRDQDRARANEGFPRKNGQYNAEIALNMMGCIPRPEMGEGESQLIAFTSEDLYNYQMQNFIFGCAYLHKGLGIWSNARFGNPEESPKAFQNCLLRMMKIAVHEFGHMQGIHHCTDYECNMGGYMSLKEVDARPLLYCVQDTAKVCYLTGTSLEEHQKKLLQFFENFNQTYQLRCDFSQEIGVLKTRLARLQQNAS